MADKVFPAKVQWWDSQIVHIQCPICTKIHTHGFGHSYDSVYRVAHCSSGSHLSYPSYRFQYPFSETDGMTAYEIDKINERYVALGADPPAPESDLLEDNLANLNLNKNGDVNLKRWQDAVENITIGGNGEIRRYIQEAGGVDDGIDEGVTMRRIDWVLSQMISFGNEDRLRQYLDSSSESQLFLHGINDTGETALLVASCEKYPAIVKLLLERGANADFQNEKGRTSLMEAALWGRYDNVVHLLRHGANKNLKDENGFKAAQLAEVSYRNEEERYMRSGGEHQVYREITYTANQARRMIVYLLTEAGDETPIGLDSSFANHIYKKASLGTVKLLGPIAEYPVPNQWKTIARLERGHPYPSVAAMSGWSHADRVILMSGKDCTSEVFRIAEIVGHTLKPDNEKDQGMPGRYHASHAEKQLVAYFISRHVFLECEKGGILHHLATATPPVMLKYATILVSSQLCSDCIEFNKLVNSKLNLNILLLNRSEWR